MDAQGDNLLQRLVEQEQTLAGKVEAAQKEASEIVAKAHDQAGAILRDARERADARAASELEAGREEAERERAEALARAEADRDRITERGAGGRAAAVELVLERVLP